MVDPAGLAAECAVDAGALPDERRRPRGVVRNDPGLTSFTSSDQLEPVDHDEIVARGLDPPGEGPVSPPYPGHRTAARQRNDVDGFNLWAGEVYDLTESVPAAELIVQLAEHARTALAAATRRL